MARQKGWGNGPDDLDKIWSLKKWDIYNNDLLRNEESIESPVNQTTLTRRYTEAAVNFIKANQDGPFLLYMPHTMVHVPLLLQEQPRRGHADGQMETPHPRSPRRTD